MKTVKRFWPWLSVLLFTGVVCVTYLLAQVQLGNDSERLLAALSASDYQAALEILQRHGVAEDTLLVMADRLPRPAAPASLNEPFFRGTVSLPLDGRLDELQARITAASNRGYGRFFLLAQSLAPGWETYYDSRLALFPTPPVGALDLSLSDTNLIEYFKWYDRHAEQLHSVVLNWTHLDNHLRRNGTAEANRVLKGFFQLIKARKPDAFVWMSVVSAADGSDTEWLRAMTFKPDGLLVWDLDEFQSPYELAPGRLWSALGAMVPLVPADFKGFSEALVEKGGRLVSVESEPDSPERASQRSQALAVLGGVGKVVGSNLDRLEAKLQTHGYRGLTVDWLLLEALAHQNEAAR